MLPEKKKNIKIALIVITLLIIVVAVIIAFSNMVRKHNDTSRNNDEYFGNYQYFGIAKNDDDNYLVYGINENEDYLNLRSFYKPQSILINNNRLLIYTNAVNELRYEKKENSYYFYELDNVFSSKNKFYLSDDYLVYVLDGNIFYHRYGEENDKEINNIINNDLKVKENKVYYAKSDGIYEYLLDEGKESLLVSGPNLNIYDIYDNMLYYLEDNNMHYINVLDKVINNISDNIDSNAQFEGVSSDGLNYAVDNILYTYNPISNTKEMLYEANGKIVNSFYISLNYYYIELENSSYIIDKNTHEKVKNLTNKYVYIGSGIK